MKKRNNNTRKEKTAIIKVHLEHIYPPLDSWTDRDNLNLYKDIVAILYSYDPNGISEWWFEHIKTPLYLRYYDYYFERSKIRNANRRHEEASDKADLDAHGYDLKYCIGGKSLAPDALALINDCVYVVDECDRKIAKVCGPEFKPDYKSGFDKQVSF